MSVEGLMRTLERDRDYWGPSGGVTFSGGEPLNQPEFLLAMLHACRDAYIHTVLETSAHASPDLVLEVASLADWLFVDLKHMSTTRHQKGTGVGNERILSNLERLSQVHGGARVVVRIPVIPGFNDSHDNMQASARFLDDIGLHDVNLLPFHRMATSKYEQLNLTYVHAQTEPPTSVRMESLRNLFGDVGLHCYVGSETPF